MKQYRPLGRLQPPLCPSRSIRVEVSSPAMPPQWYKINSTGAEEMFREAIGGLTIQVEQGAINQAIIQSVSNDPDLAPELPTIVKSMSYTTLSALGNLHLRLPIRTIQEDHITLPGPTLRRQ